MELPSGRRPEPTPPPRCSLDRISALPDEMLLQILAGLRSARAAAHTSGLSRRWRHLWRHLPELSFRDVSADGVESALAKVASPALSLLEVRIPRSMDAARVSALLHAAARLAPADLVFSVRGSLKYWDVPIEIPCFGRATSVKMCVMNLLLTPPSGGAEFPLLEKLPVNGCRLDPAELILRCPRLRVFEIGHQYKGSTVKVHSLTIEEIVVKGRILRNLDIMAPVLKRFTLRAAMADDYTLSFSAPMLENLSWNCSSYVHSVKFGEKWHLRGLKLEMRKNVCVLRMSISDDFPVRPTASRSFSQEIAPLPAFSVLELELLTQRHAFGALVSHLLGISSTIKRLKLDIRRFSDEKTCNPNCACHQPQNWRDEVISLTSLEEVQVRGFGGTDQEVDILKLLFRCASLMKRMTVVLVPKLLPTNEDCKEIYTIFQEYPDVKCSVYRNRCKE